MYRGDDLAFGKLPHVQLVEGENPINLEDGGTNFIQGNGRWYTLQQNEGCAANFPQMSVQKHTK